MSVKASNWVWGLDVTGSEKLVLLCLGDHADNDGVCWPGLAAVSEKTGISERQVMRIVSGLEKTGLLTMEKRKGAQGRQQSNLYKLDLKDTRLKARTTAEPGDTMSPGEAQIPGDISAEPGDISTGGRVTIMSPGTTKNVRTVTEPSIESSAQAREIRFEQDRLIGIPEALKAKWRQVFPGIDVEREIGMAELWLVGPPRRTKKHYSRFLTSWMSKAHPGESASPSRARAVCAVCGEPAVMTVGKAPYCDKHGTGALL